jgi:chloride channel protein, CIC family
MKNTLSLRSKIDVERLRHVLRDNQPAQIVLCALLGAAVGLGTLLLHLTVLYIHRIAFALPPGARLSSATAIDRYRIMIVPAAGGILLGLVMLLSRYWKRHEIVDPIEANAIYGGRMSAWGSLRLLAKTLISNAAGASLGMEAAYTQSGSWFFSYAGQKLHLRRQDMRILVAAGSAAAIAAAFNAPMAGAFYGFELVLGTYTVTALSQVSAAALAAALTVRALTAVQPVFSLHLDDLAIPGQDYFFFILLGVLSAGIGILTMKSVTWCEQLSRKVGASGWLSPALGGLLVSAIAVICPQVLGSGQGAIGDYLTVHGAFSALLILLAAKIAASAVSVGSGFKGGLFSTSLFIGCLLGQAVGVAAAHMLPDTPGQIISFTLVGMGSVAASIVGAPVTMIMLVLEMTGNFTVTTGVLAGVLVSSAITRYSFGYSFSTWRFHLRGLPIRGAEDVGWVRELTVRKLLTGNLPAVPAAATLPEIRNLFPAGGEKYLFVVDGGGKYKGMIDTAGIYDPEADNSGDDLSAEKLAKGANKFLLAEQDIRTALALFAEFEMEALPVLEAAGNPKLIGQVSESYTLRRYAHELESHNMEKYGSGGPGDNPLPLDEPRRRATDAPAGG